MNGNCGTNAEMTHDISGNMAFVVSSWSTYDTWLWKDRCKAQGCNGADMYFKNIAIRTGGGGPTPTSPPSPGDFSFGNACTTKKDG